MTKVQTFEEDGNYKHGHFSAMSNQVCCGLSSKGDNL